MSRILAWSHWQLICQSLSSPQTGASPTRSQPISADALALAVWMCQWLDSWVRSLALARIQSGRLGFIPGRRAQLAQEQTLSLFTPAELFGCSSAQAQRVLAQEVERLMRLLEAPLMQFQHARRSNGWESARWAILICLARLGQVVRQVAQSQGQAEARRLLEAVLRVAYERLVAQATTGWAA